MGSLPLTGVSFAWGFLPITLEKHFLETWLPLRGEVSLGRFFSAKKTDLQFKHDTKTPQKIHGLEQGFLGGGNSSFFSYFHPDYLGKMDPILTFAYFSEWVG